MSTKTLPMPDSAGEWEWTWEQTVPRMDTSDPMMPIITINAAYPANRRVLVTETPGAGRMCRELRMGGSAQVGFDRWSGQWRRAK